MHLRKGGEMRGQVHLVQRERKIGGGKKYNPTFLHFRVTKRGSSQRKGGGKKERKKACVYFCGGGGGGKKKKSPSSLSYSGGKGVSRDQEEGNLNLRKEGGIPLLRGKGGCEAQKVLPYLSLRKKRKEVHLLPPQWGGKGKR